MKILKISVSGYKLLEDNFTVDFLTKARVNAVDKEDEVIALEENLYIPTTTVFSGKNSSGKSTALNLITFVQGLLYTGRIRYNELDFRNDKLDLDIHFIYKATIYRYMGEVHRSMSNLLNEETYCKFAKEKLYSKKYFKSYGKNIYDLEYDELEEYTSNIPDTSILYKLTANKPVIVNSDSWLKRENPKLIFDLMNIANISDGLKLKIINLFDENIKMFEYDEENKLYELKIDGIGTKYCGASEVNDILSDGTKKGLILFSLTVAIMGLGGTLIIDEIENSFHKNLVENIIMIFNDKRINKNRSNLIFSTHYVEIMDIFRRRDNIFIMNKEKYITNCNLYDDYKERIDLSKSNQFNNNTFNTLLNYDRLMSIKKDLMNEIPRNAWR